jgi:amino acid adenylation domain-containing protein/thioester reductase-like protein
LSLEALVMTLAERSIELRVEGEDLRCRAPKGALTSELKREIALHKNAILALLREGGWDDWRMLQSSFKERARSNPDRIAVAFEDEHLSCGEIAGRVERLARELRVRGAGAEVVVGLRAALPVNAVLGVLAIAEAGAACLPSGATSGLGAYRETALLVDEDIVAGAADEPAPRAAAGGNLAFIVETEGTTGTPRRVALDRATLARAIRLAMRLTSFASEDVVVAGDGVDSGSGLLQRLLPLFGCGRLVLTREIHPSGDEIARAQASVLISTPTVFRALVAAGWRAARPGTRAVSTGEPLEERLSTGLGSAGCEVLDLYGCLEAGIVTLAGGRPLEGARMYVLGAEQQPVAVEAPGELHIGGDSYALARAYAGDGAATAERFVPDSLGRSPGSRLFRTGDRARWSPAGRIEFLGRTSEPSEWHRVESLLREHPGIRDAAVSVEGSSSRERLVAHVVLDPAAAPTTASLAQYLKGRLPPQLEPSRFLPLDRLPLTRGGRLDRSALGVERIPRARLAGPRLPGEELDGLLPRTNLTKNQLLVWAGDKLASGTPLYNIATLFRIEGHVDHARFQSAFQRVLDECELLRSVIEEAEGVPRLKVLPAYPYEVECLDLGESESGEELLKKWAKERARRPFDLSKRLFETSLIRVSRDRYAWWLLQHHLITDAWATGLLFHRVDALYRSVDRGASPQFSDFVAFEAVKRRTPAYRRAKEYWQRKLSEEAPPLEFYGPPGSRRTSEVTRISRAVGLERSRQVRACARTPGFSASSENLSIYTVFATAFLTYLFRISGNTRLSLGTTLLNRPAPFKDTIGLFMQVAPLRLDVAPAETFRTLAGKLRAEISEVMRYQRYATGNSPERRVYDALLNYITAASAFERGAFAEYPASAEFLTTGHGADALAVLVQDYVRAGDFGLDVDFHRALFDEEQRLRTFDHFFRVLDRLLAEPDERLARVELLSAAELEQVLGNGHGPETGTGAQTLVELFQTWSSTRPDAVAVACGDNALSYRELDRRSRALADRLRSRGVGTEPVVAVLLEPSLSLIIATLGVLRSGAAYLPLDVALPADRMKFLLEDSGASALVTDRGIEVALPSSRIELVDPGSIEPSEVREHGSCPAAGSLDRLAYVIYTSGSTGRPKGVAVTHGNLASAFVAWKGAYRLTSDDAHLQMANFSFDVFAGDLARALGSGGRLVLCPREVLLRAEALYALMRGENISVAEFVPVVFRGLLDHARKNGLSFDFMRILIVGSDSWYGHEHAAARTLCGASTRFFNSYGVTEATIDSAFFEGDVEEDDRANGGLVPIGRPLSNARLYALDPLGHPVPPGIVGELAIGGGGLTRGYLGRPRLTAEKFVPDAFSGRPGSRLYLTGDLVRQRRDRSVSFVGRRDHQVKVRGFRVELGEVEAALNRHPSIEKAVVAAREGRSRVKHLVAYVVFERGAAPTLPDLRAFLKSELADHLVPAAFVALDRLPTLPSGKIDRRALPPPPESSTLKPEQEYVAPRTPVEDALCRIWAEVLDTDRVGVHDDFFELGGHSLSAILLVSRVRQSFGAELPFNRLFETPTVAGLAQLLESAKDRAAVDELPDIAADGVLEPLITAPERGGAQVGSPGEVLLTGATGFLGAYVLNELLSQTEARIHCLVRCETEEEGWSRLRRNLDQFSLWRESLPARVVILRGDMARPLLGLSEERFDALAAQLDAIYHCGAWVTGLYPYQTLKATNVSGTQEVLRLAARGRWKPLHHVSTTSVFRGFGYSSGHVIFEDAPLGSAEGVVVGYSQSKWVAEKLVASARSRGMPVVIYRPGQVTGDSETGVCHTDDVWCRALKTFIELGSVPEISEPLSIELTPVDYVARALVHLSLREDSLGRAFHLINPETAPLPEVVEWTRSFGYRIQGAPVGEWREAIQRFASRETALSPLMPIIEATVAAIGVDGSQVGSFPPRLDLGNVITGLKDSGITCPKPSPELLSTYLSYFVRSGYLPPAARTGNGHEHKAGVGPESEVNVEA